MLPGSLPEDWEDGENSRRKKNRRQREEGVSVTHPVSACTHMSANPQTWDKWSCGQDGPQEGRAELRSEGPEARGIQARDRFRISRVHPVVLSRRSDCSSMGKRALGAEEAKEEGWEPGPRPGPAGTES